MTSNGIRPILWLDQHLDLFFPPLDAAIFDSHLLQRVGELAILYRSLFVSGLGPDRLMEDWRNEFHQYLVSDELAEVARKNPERSWAWLMPYFIIKELHGLIIDEHEKTLDYARDCGYPEVSEVVPYRRMDQHYFLSMRVGSTLDIETLIKSTSIASCVNLLAINREVAYSMTHTLFYTNDFGLKIMPSGHSAHSFCVTLAESLLFEHANNKDWDVLGELLILAQCIESFNQDTLNFYVNLFQSKRSASGYTPPSDKTSSVITDDLSREKLFDAVYHTTLVSALLDSSIFFTSKEAVDDFKLIGLPEMVCESVVNTILEYRNNAVLYLNAVHEQGIPVSPINSESLRPDIRGSNELELKNILFDRELLIACLSSHRQILLEGSVDMCSLAESYARHGDIEVVLKVIEICPQVTLTNPRWIAIIQFLFAQQKPDGSIGYFIRESRQLAASNIDDLRISLTDVYVDAFDALLDRTLARAA